MQKVTLFLLELGNNCERKKGKWEPSENKFLEMKGSPPFVRRGDNSYAGNSAHIIQELGKKGGYVFIDVNSRKSISPDSILKKELDAELKMHLNLTSEEKLYKNRQTIVPARYLIISALGGMGIYVLLKFLALAGGVVLP